MANPIMSMLRTPSSSASNSKTSGFPDVSKMSFSDFVKYMNGKDAKMIVDDLRATGKMSEQQYKRLMQQAQTNINSVKDILH